MKEGEKPLRLLLINPGFNYHTPYLQVTEPLGVLYLAAFGRRYSQHEFVVLDCLDSKQVTKTAAGGYWYGLDHHEMVSWAREVQPDLIGLTCMFSRKKDDLLTAAKALRDGLPNVPLVAGGTHASLFPSEDLATRLFDYCVIGEGERTLVALADALEGRGRLAEIDGLGFRENGRVHINPKQHFIKDLDSIPFPARDLINYDGYLSRKSVIHCLGLKRAASVLTSRSCPNRCNFCSMHRIHGPRWRARTPQDVVAELIHLKNAYDVQEFFVMDDNFTLNKKRVLEFCQLLKEAKLSLRWNTPNGIAINTLDYEVLQAMQDAGCVSICIAIESGDEDLRNRVIGKRLSNQKIEEVTRMAADLGLFTTAFYIIGMPGETEDRFQRTLDQLRQLPLNGVAAAFANPLPGTKLYDDCLANHWTILQDDDPKQNAFYKPYIVTVDFDEPALLRREKQFYRTFVRAKLLRIFKDTLLFRNKLLYPPFLLRILKDRLCRQ